MPHCKIKISYTTGDSFGHNDKEDYLELTWQNLDNAKENLNRIKEHYEMYRSFKGYNFEKKETRQQIVDRNRSKEWFVNMPKLYCISTGNTINEKDKEKVGEGNWEYRPDPYYAERCLYLKADNGNSMQLSAFWIGHFEILHGAEIEIDNSDMRISF
jgi:hypothetical protein